jgi:hypothetical protein
MLEFDVEVQRYIRTIYAIASFIRAFEGLFYVCSQTTVLLAILDFVQFLILLRERLHGLWLTSTSFTCLSSSANFSERSLMMAKLI